MASRAPGSVQTRPARPSAGSRATEDCARLGRKGARRRAQATAKPPACGARGLRSGPTGCKAVTPNPSLLRHAGRTHSRAPTPQQVSSRTGRGREIPPAAADVTGASLGLPRRALHAPSPSLHPDPPSRGARILEGSGLRGRPPHPQVQSEDSQLRVLHLGTLRVPRKVGAASAGAEHLEMRTVLQPTSLSNVGKTATRPGWAEQLPRSQPLECKWTAGRCSRGESWRLPAVRRSWLARPRPNGTVSCDSYCKPMNYRILLP